VSVSGSSDIEDVLQIPKSATVRLESRQLDYELRSQNVVSSSQFRVLKPCAFVLVVLFTGLLLESLFESFEIMFSSLAKFNRWS
jgi:hypothetical protein